MNSAPRLASPRRTRNLGETGGLRSQSCCRPGDPGDNVLCAWRLLSGIKCSHHKNETRLPEVMHALISLI